MRLFALSAQQPTCNKCNATYVSSEEIQSYLKRAQDNGLTDQQTRAVNIGKANIGIGVVYRGKLDKPADDSVAEHDLVSEVYHVIDGSATLVTGPDIADMKRRPADLQTVREFNGPGNGGSIDSQRRDASAQGGRRDRDSRRHRPLVHQDRRSHSLRDGADRSG